MTLTLYPNSPLIVPAYLVQVENAVEKIKRTAEKHGRNFLTGPTAHERMAGLEVEAHEHILANGQKLSALKEWLDVQINNTINFGDDGGIDNLVLNENIKAIVQDGRKEWFFCKDKRAERYRGFEIFQSKHGGYSYKLAATWLREDIGPTIFPEQWGEGVKFKP